MKNQNILYSIIVILAAINIAAISYFVGVMRSGRFSGYGMMGREFNEEHMEEMMGHMEEEHSEDEMMHRQIDYNKPVAETHNSSHDFGKVSKSGGIVSTVFEIENHGKETLIIGDISTSCGCTSAEIDTKELGFDEEAELTVYFDPNFHEEPEGKFSRSVFVPTNDEGMPEIQFDIFVEVIE